MEQQITVYLIFLVISGVYIFYLSRLLMKLSEMSDKMTQVDNRIYHSTTELNEKLRLLTIEINDSSKKSTESSSRDIEAQKQIIINSTQQVVSSLNSTVSKLADDLKIQNQQNVNLVNNLNDKLKLFNEELNNLVSTNTNLNSSLSSSSKEISLAIDRLNKVLDEATRI